MGLTGLVTRNWRLKLAALALVVLLWILMRLSDPSVSHLTIPDVEVRVDQLDTDWVLRGAPSPATVEITLVGPLGELFRAALAEPVVMVPVDSVAQEDVVMGLMPDWVRNVDRGSVEIEDFAPSSIRLIFERRVRVEIPVSWRTTGDLPDSLAVATEPHANLLFAQVTGPASLVDPIETVFLEPFDLGEVAGSGRFEVSLDTTGLGGELTVSPLTALLTVDVAPRQSWVLGRLAVDFPGGDEGWIIEPDTLEVTLAGAELQLDAVDVGAVRVVVAADVATVRMQLERDGEARVPVAVGGLTRWVRGVAAADSVTVRVAGPP